MYTNIVIKTLIGIGITQYKFYDGIVDETTYLEKCQEQVGVTTTNDAIFGVGGKVDAGMVDIAEECAELVKVVQ